MAADGRPEACACSRRNSAGDFPGVDPLTIERLMVEMDQGMGVTEANSLAQQIVRFWGVSKDGSADMSIVEGIAESVASELLRAMFETGLLKKNTIRAGEKEGLIGQR